ncbi:MAG: GTP 3',8-cyclase MoaA [Candidatus Thiodiazotropha sp. (ex Lucina aurantia)]|nr:GTP 3',8-cyclase MoaA [Candidatus Thiodiazotropha sp. (ex Lucina pensylvanica)]MBT3017847.1 GTP 3',8-cyclase MoaA [Candidatus Thiodiazotropha taylori]MBV2099534.1 GTP 3',8-cyclase MoaA [Candidatus Thiodiazotropha sp. (ex Codakia orbicularis)]MBV2104401.1 GTP 3',8-cyclase MoaA [Candidatus Thiodiazotropha sp. (ex Lucina aurantia)]MCG7861583.1 GTP 3',8-cyclase MoaA [Candidatus Thiodiazotropha endolucinida]
MNRESPEQQTQSSLVDRFNRRINYLRISVTDRCDLRCIYCMSEDMEFVPRSQLLTLEELFRVGKSFVEMGVRKIRITGGEPLTRRGVMQLFESLGELDGLDDLTLTTNGTLLHRYAKTLQRAGVTRVNISLDSLQEARFRKITRIGDIRRTLTGIDAALEAGFQRVKINSVILKNRNHDEIPALVAFAEKRGMDISFIEEMPLGETGDHDRAELYYSSQQVLQDLQPHYDLIATTDTTGGPARYYRINDSNTRVGFISPHSHNFCDHCNRVRLTAEGRLLLCLGQEHSMDLRRVVRANPLDDEPLRQAIIDAMKIKPKGHEFDLTAKPVLFRHMNVTGG